MSAKLHASLANIPPKDKVGIISNLGTMLSAGIPILEAVETLTEDSRGGARKFLLMMHEALNEGQPISYAMSKMPRAFDPITINLVKAGEEAGTLEDTLRDLEHTLKREIAFRDKLRASMTYPAFIALVFLGVLILILTFVVPRIGRVFLGLNVPLPPVTLFMIQVSDAVLKYYPFILGATVGLVVLLVLIYRWQQRAVKNFLLSLPLLRRLGRLIDLSRFTRSMGLLLRAGIPVAEALELSKDVVTKREMMSMVEDMKHAVDSGKPLSDGLVAYKAILPPIMIHILGTAERTGTLEQTMQELANYFQTQVSRNLKTISTLIEPIMIVFIGLFVGGMMLAIIAPIYNLISQINRR